VSSRCSGSIGSLGTRRPRYPKKLARGVTALGHERDADRWETDVSRVVSERAPKRNHLIEVPRLVGGVVEQEEDPHHRLPVLALVKAKDGPVGGDALAPVGGGKLLEVLERVRFWDHEGQRRSVCGHGAPIGYVFSTSSPWWLMTLTAMVPVSGTGKGRLLVR